MGDVVKLSSVWGLAEVPCVCGRKHVMLVRALAVKAHEETCFLVCPDRDDGPEPCELCSLYWRERLRGRAKREAG